MFTVEGIDSDFSADWTTGEGRRETDRIAPAVTKLQKICSPPVLPAQQKRRPGADRQLNAGDEVNVTFKNRKMPQLTIYKEDSVAGAPVEGAKFHITYTSSGESAEAPGTID